MVKYFIYKFGQFCVNRLSLRVSYLFATFVSDLQYYFSFRDRKAVLDNLRCVLPESNNLNFLAREVFRNFGKYLVEFFRMAREIDEKFIRENIEIDNLKVLDEALGKGKGVILLTAHIGNWELGGAVLGTLGYPSLAIALLHKERPVNNLFNAQREARGLTIVQVDSAARACLRALKENKIISVVGDRDFTMSGERMDFLGKQTMIPRGAATFSIKTGAPLIPTFLVRQETGKYKLIMERPFYPDDFVAGNDQLEQVLAMMRESVSVIEEKIREYPTQWLMFRRFWL